MTLLNHVTRGKQVKYVPRQRGLDLVNQLLYIYLHSPRKEREPVRQEFYMQAGIFYMQAEIGYTVKISNCFIRGELT